MASHLAANDNLAREMGQRFQPIASYQVVIFEAHSEFSGYIGAGFERDDHIHFERHVVTRNDVGSF